MSGSLSKGRLEPRRAAGCKPKVGLMMNRERAMAYEGYNLIHIAADGRIVTATIDNPPINLITGALYGELARLAAELEADPEPTVVVLKSANPDFFLAHFDVTAILSIPVDQPAAKAPPGANAYHAMCERFRTMDKVTIA